MIQLESVTSIIRDKRHKLSVERVESMAQYIDGKASYQNLPAIWVLPDRGDRDGDGYAKKNTEFVTVRVCCKNQKQGRGQDAVLINRVEEISHGLIPILEAVTLLSECKVTVKYTGWDNPMVIDNAKFQRDNHYEITAHTV